MTETREARAQRLFALCAHLSSGRLIARFTERLSSILILWPSVKEDNFSRKGGWEKKRCNAASESQKHDNVALLINSWSETTGSVPLVKQKKKKETRGPFADKQPCARDVDGAPSPLKLGVGAAAEARAGRRQAAGGRRACEREAARPRGDKITMDKLLFAKSNRGVFGVWAELPSLTANPLTRSIHTGWGGRGDAYQSHSIAFQ